MHGRPLFRSLWTVKATYPGFPGSNSWCRVPCIGFLATAPLANLRPRFKSLSRREQKRSGYWTEEEDVILVRGRTEGLDYKRIAYSIGRSTQSCMSRAQCIGLSKKKNPWTKEDDEILTQGVAAGLEKKEIAQRLLPARTAYSLYTRAQFLKITVEPRKRWTTEEDDILAQGIAGGLSYEEIIQRLPPGRTRHSVAYRIQVLNLVPGPQKRWTTKESDIVAQGVAGGLSYEEFAQRLLPGRSTRSVGKRAHILKLTFKDSKRWTTEEDEILAQGVRGGLKYAEIAKRLPGRTVNACYARVPHISRKARA